MKQISRNLSSLFVFVLISVLLVGCSSDTNYNAPLKVKNNEDNITISDPGTKTSTKTNLYVQEEATSSIEENKEQQQVFNIKDTASDNELKITVNNARFVTKIDEKNNEYSILEAQPNKQYAIIDITIENILPDKIQNISSMLSMELVDQDGYSYSSDFSALMALDKSFKDGEVMPGMKKRGEIAFLIPTDTKNLNFVYKFDVFSGTPAVFKIK